MNRHPSSESSGPGDPLRVERALEALPRGSELTPLLDLVIARSRADPERRWSASGELGSTGDRLVDTGTLNRELDALAAREAERLEARFRSAARVIEHLAEGRSEGAAEELLGQGETEESVGRSAAAAEWYEAAYRLARQVGSAVAPGALRRLARTRRALGDLTRAAAAYEEAWREAGDLGLDADRIVAATGRGNVAVDRGRWAEAERWYRRALDLVGEEGPPRRERWQLGQNLAIVRREQGALEEAAGWLTLAQEEGEVLDDPDARVEVANGWGQLFLARGDPRGAELYFRQALAAAEELRARVTVGVNLGEALLAQGRDLEAGQEAREAEALALAGRVVGKLPEVYRLLAAVAEARGEADAFVLLERALEVIRSRGLPPFEEALTLEPYAAMLHGAGDEERARELREKAESMLSESEEGEPS